MPDIANEHGFAPLLGEPSVLGPDAGASAASLMGRAPRPVAPQRRKRGAAREMLDGIGGLGWSVIGFVGGAVFWHFIGFWGFVSEVVLVGGPMTGARQPVMHVAAMEARPPVLRVAAASHPSCTQLALDRRTGVTSAEPCDAGHATLPADSFQGRQDRVLTNDESDGAPVHFPAR